MSHFNYQFILEKQENILKCQKLSPVNEGRKFTTLIVNTADQTGNEPTDSFQYIHILTRNIYIHMIPVETNLYVTQEFCFLK